MEGDTPSALLAPGKKSGLYAQTEQCGEPQPAVSPPQFLWVHCTPRVAWTPLFLTVDKPGRPPRMGPALAMPPASSRATRRAEDSAI